MRGGKATVCCEVLRGVLRFPLFGHKCRPDQVRCADITCRRVRQGFMRLVAIMDGFTRHVVAWEISKRLDAQFCLECLHQAMKSGLPEIFNTDQGSPFTANLSYPLFVHSSSKIFAFKPNKQPDDSSPEYWNQVPG